MERRSPTGIARERETRPNNAAPKWSAGLRPASRGSAKPAPTTPPPTWSAGQFSRWGPPTGIARERETRTNNAAPYRLEWRTPCSIRTAPLAPLRGAVPTRGRRSLAGASLVLNQDCAARPAARGGADQRSAFPCRRVACAQSGLRCSLRFAQRCRPEVGVPLPARRLCSIRTALFAALRAAVPTRGRRSLACAPLVLNQDCAARPAARGGADQRSAFPCRRVACAQSGLRRSPRCAGRCRPEVGVPLPARRLCSIGIAPSARLRRAVPTRGRRSLAGASLVLNQDCAARPAARGGADQRSAFPCRRVACAQSGLRRPPACGGRCRPEVGVPVPARHRARGGYPPRCVARRLASRPEGERGESPLSHFPPKLRAANRVRCRWFFARSGLRRVFSRHAGQGTLASSPGGGVHTGTATRRAAKARAAARAESRGLLGTPTSGQFSRWGPAQPAEGGRTGKTQSSRIARISVGTPTGAMAHSQGNAAPPAGTPARSLPRLENFPKYPKEIAAEQLGEVLLRPASGA